MSNRFLAYTRTYSGPQGIREPIDDNTERNIGVYQFKLFRNEENSKDRTGIPNGESPRVSYYIKHVKISFSTIFTIYRYVQPTSFDLPTHYSIVYFCCKQDIDTDVIYWNDLYTLPQKICFIKTVNIGKFLSRTYSPSQQNYRYIYDNFHPDTRVFDFNTDLVLNPGEELVFNIKVNVDWPKQTTTTYLPIFMNNLSEHGVDYEIDFN